MPKETDKKTCEQCKHYHKLTDKIHVGMFRCAVNYQVYKGVTACYMFKEIEK